VDDQNNGSRAAARPPAFAQLASQAAGAGTRVRPARPIRFTPSRTEPVQPPTAQPHSPADRPSLIARLGVWISLAIGWSIFVAWWVIVLQRESTRSLGVALGLLATTLAASAIAMWLWTSHNIRIAKKGKRGRSSLYIPMQWERDTLGRTLELPADDAARTAAEVRVVLAGKAKSYVVVDTEEL
jgi:hypothetical protein